MKSLIIRSLSHRLSSPAHHLRRPLFLIHTAAADDPHRRRTEPYSSHSPPPFHRRHEEESRNVNIAVWWDFENCHVPVGVNVFRVAQRITTALRSSGIRGPVTINAFGDVLQLSRSAQEALIASGVTLTHVPNSGKNSSDRSFMAELVYWVSQNPPPAHFFLISGDRDFANILHRLRMRNYNILLASTDTASGVLCSAATIMWPWSGLAKGENVTAKHFNHPPDGVYGSWYGHYKGALDDPFADAEQIATAQPEESMESITEVKPRQIPKTVVNGIRQVLHSYPEGIIMSELRTELKRNNITMDKDFFGHKKFSQFLSSLPNILKFIPNPGEGQPLVVSTRKKTAELVEPSSKYSKMSDINDGYKSRTSAQHVKPLPSLPPPTDLVESPHYKEADTSVCTSTLSQGNDTSAKVGTHAVSQPTPTEVLPGKEVDADNVSGASTPEKEQNLEVGGFFMKIWKILVGSGEKFPVEENGNNIEVESTKLEVSPNEAPIIRKSEHADKVQMQEKSTQSKSCSHSPRSGSSSLDANKSPSKDQAAKQSEEVYIASPKRVSFFRRITNWLVFPDSGVEGQGDSSIKEPMDSQVTVASGEQTKALTSPSCVGEAHDLYSKPYFWNALNLFLQSEKASDLISKSKMREQLVHGLQTKFSLLNGLTKSHILHLVDLLISEKKWVEEDVSQKFPFKLALPDQTATHGSNGLSSLFSGKTSQSNLHRLPEPYKDCLEARPPQNLLDLKAWFQKVFNDNHNVDIEEFHKLFERDFNRKLICSFYGHSNVESLLIACLAKTRNYQDKKRPPTREEILSDCNKLLTELFEEKPQGFNIGLFRPRFVQKYGYALDHGLLGYPKLASLLQIMPGVRMESAFILPAAKFPFGSSQESAPVNILENRRDVKSSDEDGNGEECVWSELGPVSDTTNHKEERDFSGVSFSEDEFTDSEDDARPRFEGSEKKDSSLLQILDSWYNVKEGGEKDQIQSVEGLVDCSRSSTQKFSEHKHANPHKINVRPTKPYSFVSDSGGGGEKEKLLVSILGSLKKAGEAKLQS